MDKLIQLINEDVEMSINEQGAREFVAGIEGGANALKTAKPGVYNAFRDVLSFAKNDKNQILGLTKNSPNKLVPLTTIDDLLYALKTERGMSSETLGLLNQGLLKSSKTPSDLINNITKEVVGTPGFIKTYGKKTPNEMKALLKQKGYSDSAIESLMANAKKNPKFKSAYTKGVNARKAKKLQNGQTVELTPTSTTNPTTSTNFTASLREKLLKGIASGWTYKKALAWGAGLGISAALIWWAIYESNIAIPNDTPLTEPKPTPNEWGECFTDILAFNEGRIVKTPKGHTVILIPTSDDYPGGLTFYSNNRVINNKTKEMGTWSCTGSKVKINESINEVVNRVLNEKLLSEQQITDSLMDTYVDTAVDDLDGYVAEYNLASLKNILLKLKGKTYNGKDAIKEFLRYYSEDERGDDFIADVESVSTANLSIKAKNMKPEIIKLASGISTSQQSSDSTMEPRRSRLKINTVNEQELTIKWDKDKKSSPVTPPKVKDGGTGKKKIKSKYHDCEGKDFPLEFGCKSSKIKEVQQCLGVSADGMLGPNTMKALTDDKYDTSRGLSKDVYDAIKGNCSQGSKRDLDTTIIPTKTMGLKMSNLAPTSFNLPDISKLIQSNPQIKDLYDAFKDAGYIRGDANETTLEDGTVLPATKRVKYKGPDLDDETLNRLDGILSSNGYERIKQKIDKSYGDKYVWLQR